MLIVNESLDADCERHPYRMTDPRDRTNPVEVDGKERAGLHGF